MNPIARYLRDFNQDYLSTLADRRRTRQTMEDFLATLVAIVLLAIILYVWQA